MSRENVDIVRGAIEAFNRSELPLESIDPAIEWHANPNLPDATTHRGHTAASNYVREWAASFDEFRVEPKEFFDVGECVVVSLRFLGRMKGSDQTVELEETHVWRLRDGRATEIREYSLESDALDAVALS